MKIPVYGYEIELDQPGRPTNARVPHPNPAHKWSAFWPFGSPFSDPSGRRQTADGRRQTADGRRQTADGRRQTVDGTSRPEGWLAQVYRRPRAHIVTELGRGVLVRFGTGR